MGSNNRKIQSRMGIMVAFIFRIIHNTGKDEESCFLVFYDCSRAKVKLHKKRAGLVGELLRRSKHIKKSEEHVNAFASYYHDLVNQKPNLAGLRRDIHAYCIDIKAGKCLV